MTSFLKRIDPFLAALLGVVLLGLIAPVSGLGATIIGYVVTTMIVLLFFFQGARLPREAVISALGHWRLHSFILATTFLLFPAIGLGLRHAVPNLFDDTVWTGILFLCALPSTIQTSVALTAIARGNVAAAVTSAAGSNIIGIVLTPMLLAAMLSTRHAESAIDLAGVGRLALLLLVPFALGQLFRQPAGAFMKTYPRLLKLNDRGAILPAVYKAFSAATVEGLWSRLPVIDLLALIALCGLLLLFVMSSNWNVSARLGFSREDRITILMCGSKKSLASGVPMAAVLFSGPAMGLIMLPLLIYHQIQLIVCASVAQRLGRETG